MAEACGVHGRERERCFVASGLPRAASCQDSQHKPARTLAVGWRLPVVSPATLSGSPPTSEAVAQLASELVAGTDQNHWPLCVGIRSFGLQALDIPGRD